MITSKDRRWVELAWKLSKNSPHPKYKYTALVVKSRLVSTGFNKNGRPKFFVREIIPGQGHHAEIDALLGLDKSVTKGATLYCAGMTNLGTRILTRPCRSCFIGILKMGVRRIVYHDNQNNLIEEVIR